LAYLPPFSYLPCQVQLLSKEAWSSAMRTIRIPCLSPLNSPSTSPSQIPKLLAPSLIGRLESLAVDGSDDTPSGGKRVKRVGLKPTRMKVWNINNKKKLEAMSTEPEVQRLGSSSEVALSHIHQPEEDGS